MNSFASPIVRDRELVGIVDVIENILFRGSPSRPSPFLVSEFGESPADAPSKFLSHPSDRNWEKTIKGGEFSNPAALFYKALCDGLPHIAATFLPECPFKEIVDNSSLSEMSAVDFYSPALRLAIEIDGSQHKEVNETELDRQRDLALKKAGVTVLRIPVANVNEAMLPKYLADIQKRSRDFGLASLLEGKPERRVAKYIVAFRFQIAFLEAVRHGLIDLEAPEIKISLRLHGVPESVIDTAYTDLIGYLNHAFALCDRKLRAPTIQVVSTGGLVFDIDPFDTYDETIYEETDERILVRGDYFDFGFAGQSPSTRKDYYHPLCSDFRYDHVNKNNPKHSAALHYFLKVIFGYDEFRPQQEELIQDALSPKKGIIGILPTGSGKSLCYQMVSFLTPCLSIVVSPLSLLMKDQSDNLESMFEITRASYINASPDGQQNLNRFQNQNLKILYISPERFFNDSFTGLLRQVKPMIGQIVIDEVHCLSEWGHDFRTSYLLLFVFLENLGLKANHLLMGVTATASIRVSEDIKKAFGHLKSQTKVVRSVSVKRKELRFSVIFTGLKKQKNEALANEVNWHAQNREKTLVFVPYKRETEELKSDIEAVNYSIRVATYTGGQKSEEEAREKMLVLEDFKKGGSLDAVVATKAFGMGIDIPDIRHTIHYGLGSSVESMYQEMGRAGRDGKPSTCSVIFYKNPAEDANIRRFMQSELDVNAIRNAKGLGELTKQLFLMSNSQFAPDDEAMFTYKVYQYLSKASDVFALKDCFWAMNNEIPDLMKRFHFYSKSTDKVEQNFVDFQNTLEKSMYRLVTLGLMDLWTLNYRQGLDNPLFQGIRTTALSAEELSANLSAHIIRYDADFDALVSTIPEAIQKLCFWSYQTFFLNRWNSLRNIYDMMDNFRSSEEFADRVENFFMTNDELANAVKKQFDVNLAFSALDTVPAEDMRDQIARYIEEYQNNVAVNIVSGVTRLCLGDFFTSPDGAPRYRNAIQGLKKQGLESHMNYVFRHTSRRVESVEDKKAFARFVIDEFNVGLDDRTIKYLLEALPIEDRDSLMQRHKRRGQITVLMTLKKGLEEVL